MNESLPELTVNLFEVPLPDKPLTLLTRSKPHGVRLKRSEREWRNANKVVLVQPGADSSGYDPEHFLVKDLPPFLVGSLLENGLKLALESSGKEVETALTSFIAFDRADIVPSPANYVKLKKGIEFNCEFVTQDHRIQYGFFASLKVRLCFEMDLTDQKLAESAIGERVYLTSADGPSRTILLSVDQSSKLAVVRSDDDDSIHNFQIDQVKVPPSRPILAKYCRSVGSPGLDRQIFHSSQEASFRLGRNGLKNRAWLKQELEFVRAWLLRASSGGRIPFVIPNSPQDVYLSTTPTSVRFRER